MMLGPLSELRKPKAALAKFSTNYITFSVEVAAKVMDLVEGDDEAKQLVSRHVQSMCELATSAKAAESAIDKVCGEYENADPADRKGIELVQDLKAAMTTEYEGHPFREHPTGTPEWETWCELVGLPMQDKKDGDDDVHVEAGGEFKNVRCVLSQKHIFQLQEPVEDAHKFIWEKQAIVEHIRSKRGQLVTNPAKPEVPITEEELKPARKVIRAAEKDRRERAIQEYGGANPDVL